MIPTKEDLEKFAQTNPAGFNEINLIMSIRIINELKQANAELVAEIETLKAKES